MNPVTTQPQKLITAYESWYKSNLNREVLTG